MVLFIYETICTEILFITGMDQMPQCVCQECWRIVRRVFEKGNL